MSPLMSLTWALAVLLHPCASCPTGYTECASEGGTCAFDGTRSIAYGQGSTFVYQTANGPTIGCNNGVFGDPLPNVVKKCCYGGEYFTGPSGLDQASAETYCQKNGGHLASIHNQAELDAVQAVCSASGGWGCWVGLQSTNGHASWSWTDGSSVDFGFNSDGSPTTGVNPWRPNEPNGPNHEHCIEIYANLAVYGTGYNDAPCSGPRAIPLCDRAVHDPIPVQSLGWSPSLPLGECQGDCDRDTDCAGSLVCYHDSVPPGCSGTTAHSYYDYCYDPSNAAAEGLITKINDVESLGAAAEGAYDAKDMAIAALVAANVLLVGGCCVAALTMYFAKPEALTAYFGQGQQVSYGKVDEPEF